MRSFRTHGLGVPLLVPTGPARLGCGHARIQVRAESAFMGSRRAPPRVLGDPGPRRSNRRDRPHPCAWQESVAETKALELRDRVQERQGDSDSDLPGSQRGTWSRRAAGVASGDHGSGFARGACRSLRRVGTRRPLRLMGFLATGWAGTRPLALAGARTGVASRLHPGGRVTLGHR
jgi:hypothetical protein